MTGNSSRSRAARTALAGAVVVGGLICGAAGIAAVFWFAGLLTILVFPKINWAVGPTPTGYLHRYGSMLAFLAGPVAILGSVPRRLRQTLAGRSARVLGWLAVAAITCVVVMVLIALTGSPAGWWMHIPIGLLERAVIGPQVVAVLALGLMISASTPGADPVVSPTPVAEPSG